MCTFIRRLKTFGNLLSRCFCFEGSKLRLPSGYSLAFIQPWTGSTTLSVFNPKSIKSRLKFPKELLTANLV